MFSKENQLKSYYSKRKKKEYNSALVSESALQDQLNDLLDVYNIKYIRIPNGVWKWLQFNAPQGILKFFQKTFGGIPDNVCIVPISKDYNLCLNIELKTESGKLHGKQKEWSKETAVKISRSTNESIECVNEFKKQIGKCKKCLNKELDNDK
jgi:hypothetical protein